MSKSSPPTRSSPRGGDSRFTDVHVHLAALPTSKNGCRLSKRMLKSPLLKFISWQQKLPLNNPETANRLYVERLKSELASSERVQRAVLLAMDGVYDDQGRLDESRTDFLISNDYLLRLVEDQPQFLAGVSVNPRRRDAVDELSRCAARGAVLVKVLPNAQVFDPAEGRFREYYRTLARLGLILLSHVGFEFSLIGQDQSVGDPARLVLALEEGVSVVAAHGCSNGLFLGEPHFRTMLDLIRRYPNFFVDVSALSLPNRVGALLRLRQHPEVFDRLIFGTDYPLPGFAYPCLLAGSLAGWRRARAASNRFDRHVRVLEALGVPSGRDFMSLVQST